MFLNFIFECNFYHKVAIHEHILTNHLLLIVFIAHLLEDYVMHMDKMNIWWKVWLDVKNIIDLQVSVGNFCKNYKIKLYFYPKNTSVLIWSPVHSFCLSNLLFFKCFMTFIEPRPSNHSERSFYFEILHVLKRTKLSWSITCTWTVAVALNYWIIIYFKENGNNFGLYCCPV